MSARKFCILRHLSTPYNSNQAIVCVLVDNKASDWAQNSKFASSAWILGMAFLSMPTPFLLDDHHPFQLLPLEIL